MTEAQADKIIEAIRDISLESDSTVNLSVDDYNLVASIWEQLESIADSLKIIANK
jgi:hypothetical protein